MPPHARAAFDAAWQTLLAQLAADASGWVLRDVHSPNLIWLAGRAGPARVGIIDFQDAMRGSPAYDLVSLLQDARLDVSADLERRLLDRYCAAAARHDGAFDAADFRFAYWALGAQRNTKILGIFARLACRDGKPRYLRHMPRIWGYLDRCLAFPGLETLAAWYEHHLPRSARAGGPPT
jgi:aminoglycoside/choline kinase family phosphotransferase